MSVLFLFNIKNKLIVFLFQQQILHLIITDTTQDLDIHINDELVNAGYAALGNEVNLIKQLTSLSFIYDDTRVLNELHDSDDTMSVSSSSSTVKNHSLSHSSDISNCSVVNGNTVFILDHSTDDNNTKLMVRESKRGYINMVMKLSMNLRKQRNVC